MQEQLEDIIKKLNELSEKHNCRIDIDCYEVNTLISNKTQYIYKAQAIKTEEKIAEA